MQKFNFHQTEAHRMYKTGFSAIGKVFVTLLFTLLLAPAAFSQLTNASITGRIEDSTGKVVPGAKVTAIDKATSRERTVTTNEDGDFVITDLVPGRYSISAEAQGFSRSVREDVELNVGTRATLTSMSTAVTIRTMS
ncbi:MAG: carboxypeptidase-like regulatory domain-containing protein [Acidobacteria bacterium]|nr:carboxypeptidase-like regulatory domain-containing protein [Acidobacteriota bacterium]